MYTFCLVFIFICISYIYISFAKHCSTFLSRVKSCRKLLSYVFTVHIRFANTQTILMKLGFIKNVMMVLQHLIENIKDKICFCVSYKCKIVCRQFYLREL